MRHTDPKKTIDLSTIRGEKVYKELCDELRNLKIGILFNCAGLPEHKVFRFNDSTHKGSSFDRMKACFTCEIYD